MVFDEMDRDMKIAGSRPSREMQPEEDIEEIADNLFTEKESGVLAKAHDLGRELVSLLFDSDDFAYDDNDADAYNKRILLSFSAISSIEDNVRNENVALAAQINRFEVAVQQLAAAQRIHIVGGLEHTVGYSTPAALVFVVFIPDIFCSIMRSRNSETRWNCGPGETTPDRR